MFAQIAIPTPLHRLFDYQIPASLTKKIQPGIRVRVPFGNKSIIGIVVAKIDRSEVPVNKIKKITELIDEQPIFSSLLWQLLLWAADYYQYPLGEVLHQALPVLLRNGQPIELPTELFWQILPVDSAVLKRAPKQQALFNLLQELTQKHPLISQHELTSLGVEKSLLKALVEKKCIESIEQITQPVLPNHTPIAVQLSPEQQTAVEKISAKLNEFQSCVLQGITGSGKTEVYLAVIQQVLMCGQQALVLIPEIGLTPQTLQRFQERLAVNMVVLHSGLTDKERLQASMSAKNGLAQVVIGTRSAIFTDFKNLGMIVVDEAHDASFKQWEGFKYHARDLAVRRAQLTNIPVILGSATPSLTTLHNVATGKFAQINLTERIGGAKLPVVNIFDIRRQPLHNGFCAPVLQLMADHVAQGNQILVFINRRGYAPVLMCHECGWVDQCPRCNTPFTLHKQPPHLSCHHCGKQKPIPKKCAECASEQLLDVGLGTQRVEEVLAKLFPKSTIARIDRDTTRRKGELEKNLNQVHHGVAQILVGTQMLAKGHHFPNVTLVLLLDIDGGLYSADFAALENLAQLVVQVAGRAGRAEKPGQVLLQTHHPDHPLLQALVHHGYDQFAQQALLERQEAHLPPFSYLALLRAESVSETGGKLFLTEVKQVLQQQSKGVEILGPIEAPIEKRQGRYRWQLLLRADKRSSLHNLLSKTLPTIETLKSARQARWSVDVDPIELL